jgi:hypothetical protein
MLYSCVAGPSSTGPARAQRRCVTLTSRLSWHSAAVPPRHRADAQRHAGPVASASHVVGMQQAARASNRRHDLHTVPVSPALWQRVDMQAAAAVDGVIVLANTMTPCTRTTPRQPAYRRPAMSLKSMPASRRRHPPALRHARRLGPLCCTTTGAQVSSTAAPVALMQKGRCQQVGDLAHGCTARPLGHHVPVAYAASSCWIQSFYHTCCLSVIVCLSPASCCEAHAPIEDGHVRQRLGPQHDDAVGPTGSANRAHRSCGSGKTGCVHRYVLTEEGPTGKLACACREYTSVQTL